MTTYSWPGNRLGLPPHFVGINLYDRDTADAIERLGTIRQAAAGRPLTAAQTRDYSAAMTAATETRSLSPSLGSDRVLAIAQRTIAEAVAEGRDLTDAELSAVRTRAHEAQAQLDLERRAAAAAPERARFASLIDGGSTFTSHIYGPTGEVSFFRDLVGARQGDWEAAERLHRNNADGEARERRDGTTGATSMGSFIPPVWLVNETAELARAGRILAELVTPAGPPQSNSETVPRVTTGSSVASQASENAAVSETDILTAQLTRSTVTIAGQQDVSIQSLELPSAGLTDRLIFADLRSAYEAELDRQILRGSGAAGELLGITAVSGVNTITYTDATPTVGELYSKLADAIQQAAVGRKLPPSAIVMHPRRWGWITAALDTSNRPLVVPSGGAFNAAATFASAAREGRVGEMQGLPVYADSNVATNLGAGTNEDLIVTFHGPSVILREGPVQTRILPDVLSGTLGVRLQLYAFCGLFSARYPQSISTVGGTSLVPPVF